MVLGMLAKSMKKEKDTLKIYAPFYCDGKVEKTLNVLGFTDVYNKSEDFYKVLKEKKMPEHDVIVTCPPLSEDHIKRCF